MTQVNFIRGLLPDGSLPSESEAFVSAQVQQEAGQFVTDAQAAQSAAEVARDAALAAAAEALRALPGAKRSTNLLSVEDATLNHALNVNGEPVPLSGWNVSVFIPAVGGATYTGRLSTGAGTARFAAYDAARNFLHTQTDITTYTTPPEAEFLRVAFHRDLDEPQLNLGPDLLPYEPYWVRIPGLLLPEEVVGAGRPDIPGTLAPDIATRVANATSGTVFRSVDGPQGAWEWRKKGAAWICTEGELETLITTIPDTPGVTLLAPGIRLTRHPQLVTVDIDRIDFTADYAVNSLKVNLPVGFLPRHSTYFPTGAYGVNPKSWYISPSSGELVARTAGLSTDYRYRFSWIPANVWPTSA